MFKIYTDGACSGNGKTDAKGGWAYIIIDENKKVIAKENGAEINTTNQKMELMACLNGCRAAEKLNPSEYVEVYSDSAYLINCYKAEWWKSWIRNGWKNAKKQPVANRALWESIISYFNLPNYSFIKVKGHAGEEYNVIVDRMAVEARENI